MIANGAADTNENKGTRRSANKIQEHTCGPAGVICYCFLAYLKAPPGVSCMAASSQRALELRESVLSGDDLSTPPTRLC